MIPHSEVIERYISGEPSTKISRVAGISAAAVFGILKRNGVKSRDKKISEFLKRKYDYDAIINEYKNGATLQGVANKYNIEPSHALKIIKEAGVKSRGREGILRGIDHPFWKGGKTHDTRGYIVSNVGKEHRLIMEDIICRKLSHWEQVHHIDGNKQNNDISNLAIVPCRDHSRFHTVLRHLGAEINKENFLKFCRQESEYVWRITANDLKTICEKYNIKIKSVYRGGRPICQIKECKGLNVGHRFCSKHYQRYIAKKRGYWLSSQGRKTKFLGIFMREKNILASV